MATEEEITQVKNTIIEDAKEIDLANYSKATADPLANLLAKVAVMNSASENALELLRIEYNSLKEALINVADLNSIIAEADKVDESMYTVESYQVFETALANAKTVVVNATTVQEVTEALEVLINAKDALVAVETPNVDKTALSIAINMAEAVTQEQLNKVVPAVVTEFNAALEEARVILEIGRASCRERVSVPV